MSERREQLKRERRRRKLRDRRAADRAEAAALDAVVGYFAAAGRNAVCDREACVIADSAATMRYLIDQRMAADNAARYQIRQTTFAEVVRGLRLGGAYAFEPAAYDRFRPLAERAGLPLGPEQSEPPQPGAVHLVRVQWVGA